MVKMKFLEILKNIKRGPAIMVQKDIGVVLANTSIDKDSRVLDAGSGSGVLTSNLARFVKKVYSYDNRKEFLDIAKENVKNFGLDNVVFKNKDVYVEIKEKNLDLVTLDLKEHYKALDNVFNALKDKGEVVCFCPKITQVMEIVDNVKGKFKVVRILENIERDWVCEGERVRPDHKMLAHTAFMVILRKV